MEGNEIEPRVEAVAQAKIRMIDDQLQEIELLRGQLEEAREEARKVTISLADRRRDIEYYRKQIEAKDKRIEFYREQLELRDAEISFNREEIERLGGAK